MTLAHPRIVKKGCQTSKRNFKCVNRQQFLPLALGETIIFPEKPVDDSNALMGYPDCQAKQFSFVDEPVFASCIFGQGLKDVVEVVRLPGRNAGKSRDSSKRT
jgi:hypothetical protein